jgi:hypothetical protein
LFAGGGTPEGGGADREGQSTVAGGPTPLLWILDEIGPLELRRGEGFLPALEMLERALAGAGGGAGAHRSAGAERGSEGGGAEIGTEAGGAAALRALIVVRPSLVEELAARLRSPATSYAGAGPGRPEPGRGWGRARKRGGAPTLQVYTLTAASSGEAPVELLRLFGLEARY